MCYTSIATLFLYQRVRSNAQCKNKAMWQMLQSWGRGHIHPSWRLITRFQSIGTAYHWIKSSTEKRSPLHVPCTPYILILKEASTQHLVSEALGLCSRLRKCKICEHFSSNLYSSNCIIWKLWRVTLLHEENFKQLFFLFYYIFDEKLMQCARKYKLKLSR